ncbi:MAG: sulfide-dependent adenosine diphosphate thiazole synthase [Acidilobaceae archaeon]
MRESSISRAIIKYASRDLEEFSEVDVAIVGAGPSGLTASYYLAKRGFKVLVFERRLSFGGGTGPGGNMLPRIAVQEEAVPVLEEFQVRYIETEYGVYLVDPVELIAKLARAAIDAGARILLGAHVEDVIYRSEPLRISGVLWVWSPIKESGMHVDPLYTEARAVVDATGHDAEVVSIAARKLPELGLKVAGEKSNYTEVSERLVVENTGRVAPGLYVTGVAVCTVHGLPRMGPIFGGMLLSGRRVAEIIAEDLGGGRSPA